MHGRAPLSRALCLTAISLPLAQYLFPIATQMNSVVTELCHDLKFSCRDLVSTAYTYLYLNKEKSYRKIESPFLACCAIIPLLSQNSPVACAWPGLLRTPGLLCHNTTRRRTVVRASLRMPSLVVCGRAFCRGNSIKTQNPLSRQNFSLPWLTLPRHNFSLPCPTLSRHKKILNHDKKSSQPIQLCRDIELLYRNTKPLLLATLYCNIKTLCCDRKLMAWSTLSRQ